MSNCHSSDVRKSLLKMYSFVILNAYLTPLFATDSFLFKRLLIQIDIFYEYEV